MIITVLGMWHFHQFTDEALVRAVVSFRRAIELDQSVAYAHAGMARALLARTMYHGADRKLGVSSALEAGRRALALDGENVEAYYVLSVASSHNDDPDVAFEFAQRATKLNDNFAPGHFALWDCRVVPWTTERCLRVDRQGIAPQSD